MKKLLLVFGTILLLFAGCKKEAEMKLSGFIIGEWLSTCTTMETSQALFEININGANYVITVTSAPACTGGIPHEYPATDYAINDQNSTITITQLDFTPDDGVTPTASVIYSVIWYEGEDSMDWIPNTGGSDPIIYWEKQ